MKVTAPDAEKHKRILIILSSIIIGCLFVPIVFPLLYIISIPGAGVCGYLIYSFSYKFKEQADAKKLYDCVTVKEICNIDKISKDLGWDNHKTRGVLDYCVKKGYLDDYIRVGEELRKKNDEEDAVGVATTLSSKKSARKCPHCGGVAEYYEDQKVTCIYCGNVIESDK